jgi:predicted transglutaminase-like cysteine proteinase
MQKFYIWCALLLLIVLGGMAVGATTKFYVPDKNLSAYKKKYGDQAVRRLNGLLNLMTKLENLPEDKKVIQVNKFFNQLKYASDMKNWGKKDYWATRLEFLGVGRGDCEDYSVAKFLTLLQLGVPQKKLFLTYVKATGYAEAAHLVVSYYKKPGTVPFVLDNYNKKILPATKRKDLVPVYSFTANDLYVQRQKGLGKRVNPKSSKNLQKLKAVDLEIHKR